MKRKFRSPYSISVDKKNIKETDHKFRNGKILKHLSNITEGFKDSVKVVNYRKKGTEDG